MLYAIDWAWDFTKYRQEIQRLAKDDANIDLWSAAALGLAHELRRQIRQHPNDINRMINGRPPLAWAAEHGQIECIKILSTEGADPSAGAIHMTALECAAMRGQAEAVRVLLSSGAKLPADEGRLGDLLIMALNSRSIDTLVELDKVGAIERSKKERGLLLSFGVFSPRVAQLFLRDPMPPAELAKGLCSAAARNQAATIHLLVQRGALVDLPDSHGVTPLVRALAFDAMDSIVALLADGADPRKAGLRGDNALAYARSRGNWLAVRMFEDNLKNP